ncbi:hypothetical protein [Aureimonas leprariae]|uniref:Uncharacterized protein n=1 Tax=Plantimonas leprariae TaxID=2615207 RepID=A0A7V7PSJ0_9HYPH|nr:hypothetical protein [Aureimonas leprariae]KAB0682028.1 hypothetical protein F6X38_04285 [Aureimonas leprariae]
MADMQRPFSRAEINANAELDPLADVPTDLHDALQPYLRLADTYGRQSAEQIFTVRPPPWADGESEVIVGHMVQSFDKLLRDNLDDLPDYIFAAIGRKALQSFMDRLGVLYDASGSGPKHRRPQ